MGRDESETIPATQDKRDNCGPGVGNWLSKPSRKFIFLLILTTYTLAACNASSESVRDNVSDQSQPTDAVAEIRSSPAPAESTQTLIPSDTPRPSPDTPVPPSKTPELIPATRTLTPVPAAPPTDSPLRPTDTPLPEVVTDLKKSLIVGTGGAPPTLTPFPDVLVDLTETLAVDTRDVSWKRCSSPPKEEQLPAITGKVFNGHRGHLCLWGFPLNETVHLELIDPEGTFWGPEAISIEEPHGAISVTEVLIWPAGFPRGQWLINVEFSQGPLTHTLGVYPSYLPIVDVVPEGDNYLFLGERWRFRHRNTYRSGQVFQVIGAKLPPDRTLRVGLFYRESEEGEELLTLVRQGLIETDQTGGIHYQMEVDSSDQPGLYCVVIPLIPWYLKTTPSDSTLSDVGALDCFMVVREND